jgi:hypothetical protein
MLVFPVLSHAETSAPYSILDGETVVPPGRYVAWRVPADTNPSQAGVLAGELRSKDGSGGKFAVAVLTASDFASWRKGYRAYPIYAARQVSQVEVRARLPRPDVYYLVVSNPLMPPHASTIRGSLSLFWVPASDAVASTAPVSHGSVRRDLISFGVVSLLALALALWSILDARRETAMTVEKRAA